LSLGYPEARRQLSQPMLFWGAADEGWHGVICSGASEGGEIV